MAFTHLELTEAEGENERPRAPTQQKQIKQWSFKKQVSKPKIYSISEYTD